MSWLISVHRALITEVIGAFVHSSSDNSCTLGVSNPRILVDMVQDVLKIIYCACMRIVKIT
jgi:hypothetical protein